MDELKPKVAMKVDISVKSADAVKAFEKLMNVATSPFKYLVETKTFAAIDSLLADKLLSKSIKSIAATLEMEEKDVARLALNANKFNILDTLNKQKNREAVANKAIELIDGPVNSEQLNPDWIADFFDACANTSEESMQLLWAKLLKGELSKTGTFSKKTIQTVKVLTKEEAQAFTSFCEGVFISGQYDLTYNPKLIFRFRGHPMNDPGEPEKEFSFKRKFDHLRDSGLILIDVDRKQPFRLPDTMNYHGIKVKFSGAESDVKYLSTRISPLTKVGEELFKICGAEPNIRQLKAIKRHALRWDKVLVEW